MEDHPFANPWEHARLLSDQRRNEAMVEVLRRHARGARIVEVGCGTGLLSCIAAKLGAKKVYAVEPTPLADDARCLVRDNGLEDVVEVLDGRIEDLEPREVDFAFSELLNADPFMEGVLSAMDAVTAWTPRLYPRRLRVWTALVREGDSAREMADALHEVGRLSLEFALRTEPVEDALRRAGVYRYVATNAQAISRSALLCDLALGTGERPPEEQLVEVEVADGGIIGGAVVWFEADLDDGIVMSNPPGRPGHWGHQIHGWPRQQTVRPGRMVLRVRMDEEDGVEVEPA